MQTSLDRLRELVRSRYENGDPSHDLAHIERVIASCRKLGSKSGADLSILLPAAYLHDVINVPKNSPDRARASTLAAEEARTLLRTAGYDETTIDRIAIVIREHSYSLGLKPSSIESAVMQDSDRLDAIGAIGVMRCLTTGARMGSSYYPVADPFAEDREFNDKQFTVDHFYVKLLKLADGMNTEAGREEGRRRTEYMRGFLDQLRSEIEA